MRFFMRYSITAVFFMLASFVMGQTNQWRDIYRAKKKDTIFGIAKAYNITVDELKEANPEMKREDYQLKKDDFVFIPFEKKVEEKQQPVSAKPADDLSKRAIRVGIMLPLHQVDGDGKRMLEYYRGLLMGCEQLKREGISTEIHAWNVDADADIRHTLLQDGASKCDIVFGPLYTRQVSALANFCKTYDIKMVIPFSINGDDVQHTPNIFQVYRSPDALNNSAISAFIERFPKSHPVFIDCNDSTSKKGVFTMALRRQLEAMNVSFNITNLKSDESSFAKAFSRSQPNVVVLNSARSPELGVALAKLNALKAVRPELDISLYGYTEWLMYTKNYLESFHKFNTYIPSTFFYNPLSQQTKLLEQVYRRWFKSDMQYALPRFAITGYDHAMFFLRGLHLYGKDFQGTASQQPHTPLQTPLRFERTNAQGGMQNNIFQLVHYKPDHSVDLLTY